MRAFQHIEAEAHRLDEPDGRVARLVPDGGDLPAQVDIWAHRGKDYPVGFDQLPH